MKKSLCLFLTLLLTLTNLSFVFADNKDTANNLAVLSEQFVAESELSITLDDNGEQVIILTHTEQLDINSRTAEKSYAKTMAVILPSNGQEAEDIIASIENIKAGSGSYNVGDWFYGDSVYLSSTIFYTTTPTSAGFYNTIAITRVDISSRVNSGTSISSMSLKMFQTGPSNDGQFYEQSKDFNALTTRSFTPPSNWHAVYDNSFSAVGAIIFATATRSGGGSSSFSLPNNLN